MGHRNYRLRWNRPCRLDDRGRERESVVAVVIMSCVAISLAGDDDKLQRAPSCLASYIADFLTLESPERSPSLFARGAIFPLF